MNNVNKDLNIEIEIGAIAQKLTHIGESSYCAIGEITFFKKTIDNSEDIYIYNTSPFNHYVISCYSESRDSSLSDGGLIYMQPMDKFTITNWFTDDNTCDTLMSIAYSYFDSNGNGLNSDDSPMLDLSFSNLAANGSEVKLGGFSIFSEFNSTNSGLRITCTNVDGLKNLEKFYLRSSNGVSLNSTLCVEPTKNVDGSGGCFYEIDFSSYGLQDGESLSGLVRISLNSTTVLKANCRTTL